MTCDRCADSNYHPVEVHPDCDCDCNTAPRDSFGVDGFVDIPAPFLGSPEQRRANAATHRFGPPEGRCWNCDARAGGGVAAYPCGVKEPRVLVRVGSNEASTAIGRTMAAAAMYDELTRE